MGDADTRAWPRPAANVESLCPLAAFVHICCGQALKKIGIVGCLWPGSCQVKQDSRILSLAFFKGEVLASCGMMSLHSIWFELIN